MKGWSQKVESATSKVESVEKCDFLEVDISVVECSLAFGNLGYLNPHNSIMSKFPPIRGVAGKSPEVA